MANDDYGLKVLIKAFFWCLLQVVLRLNQLIGEAAPVDTCHRVAVDGVVEQRSWRAFFVKNNFDAVMIKRQAGCEWRMLGVRPSFAANVADASGVNRLTSGV